MVLFKLNCHMKKRKRNVLKRFVYNSKFLPEMLVAQGCQLYSKKCIKVSLTVVVVEFILIFNGVYFHVENGSSIQLSKSIFECVKAFKMYSSQLYIYMKFHEYVIMPKRHSELVV